MLTKFQIKMFGGCYRECFVILFHGPCMWFHWNFYCHGIIFDWLFFSGFFSLFEVWKISDFSSWQMMIQSDIADSWQMMSQPDWGLMVIYRVLLVYFSRGVISIYWFFFGDIVFIFIIFFQYIFCEESWFNFHLYFFICDWIF